jgi:hypothetical protein
LLHPFPQALGLAFRFGANVVERRPPGRASDAGQRATEALDRRNTPLSSRASSCATSSPCSAPIARNAVRSTRISAGNPSVPSATREAARIAIG